MCCACFTDSDFPPVALAEWLRAPCASIRPGAIAGAVASGARLISVDAGCDGDLDRIAAEILALDRRILWAGSAGLASALARAFPKRTDPVEPAFTPGPVLFAIGSDHPVTVAQQAALLAALPSQPVLSVPRGLIEPEQVRRRIAEVRPAALVLSGGDTAALVCRALGVKRSSCAMKFSPAFRAAFSAAAISTASRWSPSPAASAAPMR